MDLDTVIDYLEQCREDFGGNTPVVLTASDLDLNEIPRNDEGDFIALDQIPNL